MVGTVTPMIDARPAVAAGRFVRCIVGGAPFALPLARVAEVVAIGAATATAPRGWIGTLARNGHPVPIGDLAFLLGLPPAPVDRREARALILRASADNARYGVTIEAVPQVFDAGEARTVPLPPVVAAAGGLVAGTLIGEGELLLVPDIDAIIGRLATGIARGPDGRITELRALPRRGAERSGAGRERADRPLAPLREEQAALILGPLEVADGSGSVLPALPMTWIREVSPWQPMRPVPQAADAVSGLIVWRGHALPVLDLAQRLIGLPSDADTAARHRLLIVGPQGEPPRGALLVHAVRGLRTLRPADDGPDDRAPNLPDPTVIRAWTRHEGDAVALLDPAALFV
jgi:chemotaxis signal transduction protein